MCVTIRALWLNKSFLNQVVLRIHRMIIEQTVDFTTHNQLKQPLLVVCLLVSKAQVTDLNFRVVVVVVRTLVWIKWESLSSTLSWKGVWWLYLFIIEIPLFSLGRHCRCFGILTHSGYTFFYISMCLSRN